MPRITKITHKPEKERYWIYVDGEYCTSIRERTFPAMNLAVGSELSCDQVKELESHHWKHSYGEKAWEKEKVRLDKVKTLIEGIDNRLEAAVVGFGAGTTEFIGHHPEEAGCPDIEVRIKATGAVLMLVEVTGTERMRGSTYWVRPDKLTYAAAHAGENVWLILHFADPEKFVFMKPQHGKTYQPAKMEIRGSVEYYVEFTDKSPEAMSYDAFAGELKGLIAK